MKNRNVYKDIVMCAVMCGLLFFAVRVGKIWYMEQKIYDFTITSETEITEKTVSELENIKGIRRFEPVESVNVTIELDGYTLQTELRGVDIEEYPLTWKKAEETFNMGNTPVLFFGESSFSGFVDRNQNSPGKSEIENWIENYQELSLKITDEKGEIRNAKVAGILEVPENVICIEKSQMEEVWKKDFQVKEGYMEIYGNQNMKEAKKLLENAGYSCYNEESKN